MSQLALFDSFEYLCEESAVIVNILVLAMRESTLDVVYRRQILTSKVDPRTVRIKSKC